MLDVQEIVDDVIKSPEDGSLYRGLVLKNNLKVLLVSDPSTDKAAAAMDVHSGHMNDPIEIPGLAHFCEHMVFLGSEKHPKENDFTEFLTSHGGMSNAFTSSEHTTFYFDVSHECLAEALDRFAQFFLCPLFTADAMDREVNAVDSENVKNLNSDSWRLHQLDKATCNPAHPYSKFGTGNKSTLKTEPSSKGIDVRKALLDYHSRFFSSNAMALVVVARESLDDLTKVVRDLLTSVVDKNVVVPEWLDHPFTSEYLQIHQQVVPVKDVRMFQMTFPIPDLHQYYKTNPAHYVAHLLGHEGPGSVLSLLKSKGWSNRLVAGPTQGAKGFSFFIVKVDLTENGVDHIHEIGTVVFQYIAMLQAQPIQEWIYRECAELSKIQFLFKDKENPMQFSYETAINLHEFPLKEVLCGHYFMTDYKPKVIELVLSYLKPDFVRTRVVSKTFEGKTNRKEGWYGTDYSLEKIEDCVIQNWKNVVLNADLHLPPVNEFIPTNLSVFPRASGSPSLPTLIKETSSVRLWYKQDDKFFLPKSCLYLDITSPVAYQDPKSCTMTHLYVELLKDSLNEYSYAAEISGLEYQIESTLYGLQMRVRGYSDKQKVFLRKVLQKAVDFSVDEKRFPQIKDMYVRSLRNFKAEAPNQHAVYYTTFLLEEKAWKKEELADSLEGVAFSDVVNFVPTLLARLHFELLFHGNLTKVEALDLCSITEETFATTKPLLPSQLTRHRAVQLPDKSDFVFSADNDVHPSSAVEMFLQTEMQSTRSNMLLELFNQLIKESFFNVLRTQEQLGYLVHSGIRRCNGSQGLRFLIQSLRDPLYVESRIEAFLRRVQRELETLSEREFSQQVNALATKRLVKPKKLVSEANKYWTEIVSRQYNFDRDNVEVAFLKTLQLGDVVHFYNDLVASAGSKRRKLVVRICGTKDRDLEVAEDDLRHALFPSQPQAIDDVNTWKASLPLCPIVLPYDDWKSRTDEKVT
ncbi:insulin-degrading enzyme-like [Oscarella lobularis]|uniref:insulin-degrading enzyme-like n=1 Tax=Oscarella lobularis TaxID=121494 RepID=UPI003313A903